MDSLLYDRDGDRARVKWSCRDGDRWRQILAAIKGLPGVRWNNPGKYWEVAWTQVAIRTLYELGFQPGKVAATEQINIESASRLAQQKAREQAEKEVREQKKEERRARAIAELKKPWTPPWRSLPMVPAAALPGRREYQLESMQFLEFLHGRGMIGDDMGTGKTCQALSWMELHPELRPAIVVCNTSTKYQWVIQAHKWLGKKHSSLEILSGQKPWAWKPLSSDVIYILNWEILSYWAAWLDALDPKIIVGDECQAIASSSSSRTKAFVKLATPAHRHVIPMSGTPILSKPAQFFPVLHLLAPEEFKSEKSFQWAYCGAAKTPFGFKADGATNMEELALKLRKIMIRRKKEDVASELPEKIRTPVTLECVQSAEYAEIEAQVLSLQGNDALALRQKISELSRSAYAMKRQAVLSWIREFLEDSDEKLVVYAWHRVVVDDLTMVFGKQCITIHGGIDPKTRPQLVKRFVEDDKCRLAVLNIIAGGTGIDGMQEVCSNAAFVELEPVATRVMQAEDRLHRIGQRNCVSAFYLIGKGTIDEDILAVEEQRRVEFHTVMDGVLAHEQDDSQAILASLKRRKRGNA